MRRRACSAALLAALASAGCAPGLRGWAPGARERPRPPAGARAEFTPPRFDAIFAAAVDLVRERGLAIASCEAPRGALATAPVELEARCGGTTCLAREVTRVKLGHRRARVLLVREVWDPTLRGWREQDDPATREELAREERAMVDEIVRTDAATPRAPGERRDPCAPAPCRDGTCVAARGDPRR